MPTLGKTVNKAHNLIFLWYAIFYWIINYYKYLNQAHGSFLIATMIISHYFSWSQWQTHLCLLLLQFFNSHLKMTCGRSKSRGFLLLVFIIKSISKKLLIKIFHSFKIKINLPKVKIEPILVAGCIFRGQQITPKVQVTQCRVVTMAWHLPFADVAHCMFANCGIELIVAGH